MGNETTQQQIITYKLRLIASLADSLALSSVSDAQRKGLRTISKTAFDSASEVRNLEAEESDLHDVVVRIRS